MVDAERDADGAVQDLCWLPRRLISDEHVLARVAQVFDLSWLGAGVTDLYCPDNGRPGIAAEAAVRLILAAFLLEIPHDRKLMREATINVAIRCFYGLGLTERLPDHSLLTRVRLRWGAERRRAVFEPSGRVCVEAEIATGKVVRVDASLIRAIVSWRDQPHIRAVSHSSTPLDPETHATWFEHARSRDDGMWRIYREGGRDLGFVSAVQAGEIWRWSFYLGETDAAAGAGGRMLGAFLRLLPGGATIEGEVKAVNANSIRLHERLGFERVAERDGTLVFRRTLRHQESHS